MNTFIEIPARKNSLVQRKPIYGVGINDSPYIVTPVIDGKKLWCPYYQAWVNMMARCYSDKHKKKYPTYIGCSVIKEWRLFSNFRRWMVTQDWQGKQLDKDILVVGNKVYSPDNCMFVTMETNNLVLDGSTIRGKYP